MNAIFGWETILLRRTHSQEDEQWWREIVSSEVLFLGEGPVSRKALEAFFERRQIKSVEFEEWESNVIVVGHADWSASVLDAAIRRWSGDYLWVYSQEMLFASMVLQQDVFQALSYDELSEFGHGHPALEYLMEEFTFDWPEAVAPTTYGSRLVITHHEVGILGHAGYRVGRRGLTESERRQVLERVYRSELASPSAYGRLRISHWGEPSSGQRLWQMADFLVYLIQNAERQSRDMSMAIAHWRADLEWLRHRFYEPRFQFAWPDPDVR